MVGLDPVAGSGEVLSTADELHAIDVMRSNAARRRTRQSLREGSVIASADDHR